MDAVPEGVEQLLVPADVADFVGHVDAMRLDEMGIEGFALEEESFRVMEGAFFLEKHEPEEHGKEARASGGPAKGGDPWRGRLDEIEVAV